MANPPAVQARTGLSPEWDRGFGDAFTDLVCNDDEPVRAEFDALIRACRRPPAPPAPAAAGPPGPGRPEPGRTHHLRVVAAGERIQVHVDRAAAPAFDVRNGAHPADRFGVSVYAGASTAVRRDEPRVALCGTTRRVSPGPARAAPGECGEEHRTRQQAES